MTEIILVVVAVPAGLGVCYLAAVGWVHIWDLMADLSGRR